MRTIQVVLDEATLGMADELAVKEGCNRSQLVRRALSAYYGAARARDLEDLHRIGYARHPVASGEFDAWDTFLAAEPGE